MKKILIVTSSNDLTVDYLLKKFSTIPFFRFNLDQFSKYECSYTEDGFILKSSDAIISSEDCGSIYYRKPTFEDLNDIYDVQYHNFSHGESYSLIEGIIEAFSGPCLSRPSILKRANNKILQLNIAKSCGFRMPQSVITNSRAMIDSIIADKKIVKPIASGTIIKNGSKEFVQTNIFNPVFNTENLCYTPSYFQEFIDKDFEIRTTIVGSHISSVKIESRDRVDWRRPNNIVKYSHFNLPEHIERSCIALLNQLELQFGCIDILVKNDEFYFLELNANGQWAWLEMDLNLKISNSIIGLLHDH